MAERLLAAADKGVDVIAGKIAEANEELEYLDVPLGRPHDHGAAAAADDGIAGPAGIARMGVDYRVHGDRDRSKRMRRKRELWGRETSGDARRGTAHTRNFLIPLGCGFARIGLWGRTVCRVGTGSLLGRVRWRGRGRGRLAERRRLTGGTRFIELQ